MLLSPLTESIAPPYSQGSLLAQIRGGWIPGITSSVAHVGGQLSNPACGRPRGSPASEAGWSWVHPSGQRGSIGIAAVPALCTSVQTGTPTPFDISAHEVGTCERRASEHARNHLGQGFHSGQIVPQTEEIERELQRFALQSSILQIESIFPIQIMRDVGAQGPGRLDEGM